METLTFFGIGPKIGRITLPWLAITIALALLFPQVFKLGEQTRLYTLVAGIGLVFTGLVFYFTTLRHMLPGIRENRLITTGAYRFCRNPLYAAILLFIIPGVSLLMNTWVVLTTCIVGYVVFSKNIHEEEEMLERIFGEEFRKYRETTSRFFPWL